MGNKNVVRLAQQVKEIQDREERNAKTLSKMLADLQSQIHCGVMTGHRHLTLVEKAAYGFYFRCAKCKLEYFRADDSLTEKEAKLVAIIFPEQKMKGKK